MNQSAFFFPHLRPFLPTIMMVAENGVAPTLPIELWHMILSTLSKTDILSCTSVCSAWNSIALKYLFRCVEIETANYHQNIPSHRALRHFHRAIQPPSIPRYIRKITLHSIAVMRPDMQRFNRHLRRVMERLAGCSHIQHLVLFLGSRLEFPLRHDSHVLLCGPLSWSMSEMHELVTLEFRHISTLCNDLHVLFQITPDCVENLTIGCPTYTREGLGQETVYTGKILPNLRSFTFLAYSMEVLSHYRWIFRLPTLFHRLTSITLGVMDVHEVEVVGNMLHNYDGFPCLQHFRLIWHDFACAPTQCLSFFCLACQFIYESYRSRCRLRAVIS